MKKITLLCSVLLSAYVSAQTFSDNFDSYTAGQKLASQSAGAWTTWSNAPGGTEDALVSSANSVSASNSVYFSSNVSGGGPVDQVRNFGVLNTGSFSMSMNMFVETDKAAYFNFQKTLTIGQTWSLNANFNDDKTVTFDDATTINLATTYPQNAWFNFRIDINFNTNVWEVFIDNVSQGTFSNSINQIASIDIFPVDQNTPFASGFYIDDFEYTVTPYVLPSVNLAATFVSITGAYLAGSDVSRVVTVRNLGQTTITSFDITCNYNGVNEVQNVTGLNLASLAETKITITNPLTLIAGSNLLKATVSNVNGLGADGDANDDITTITLNPIVPAPGKIVVGEEGTGTWCQWCPRGAVFMDKMANTYGDKWIGIAVHNGDPMTVATYDSGIGALISGYPTALVDRVTDIDPSAMEQDFLQRITQAPVALISNTATWQPISRTLTVTVSAEFQASANSSYKLACVLTEDGVKGTSSGYNQSNAYAGGASGVMGGYETKPNPVPASQMVYDHVARAIEPGFTGMTNSFPAVVNSGETYTQTFTFTLPATWNINKMHIAGLLFNPTGKIDNAGTMLVTDATSLDEFVVTCPQPITQYFNTSGNLMPDLTASLSGGTTCTPNTLVITQTPAAGTVLNNGANTVTFDVSDNCTNTGSCSTTVNYINNASIIENGGNVISFFPNPTSDLINFSTSVNKITKIRILTIEGKEVMKKVVNANSGVMSIASLSNGVYSIEFTTENGAISTQRMIKN